MFNVVEKIRSKKFFRKKKKIKPNFAAFCIFIINVSFLGCSLAGPKMYISIKISNSMKLNNDDFQIIYSFVLPTCLFFLFLVEDFFFFLINPC